MTDRIKELIDEASIKYEDGIPGNMFCRKDVENLVKYVTRERDEQLLDYMFVLSQRNDTESAMCIYQLLSKYVRSKSI